MVKFQGFVRKPKLIVSERQRKGITEVRKPSYAIIKRNGRAYVRETRYYGNNRKKISYRSI